MNRCFHCQEPVPAASARTRVIDGETAHFCCAGCEAVAQLIADAGLDDFYRFRSAPAPTAKNTDVTRWQGFNERVVLDAYAPERDGVRELRLQLNDLRCAACGWLVERTLGERSGVCDVRLNAVTGRATLRWKQHEVPLAELLAALDALGFEPHPLRDGERQDAADTERRTFLKRLAVAGIGMMQVMMYGVAMYLGAFRDMDPAIQQFLRYVSLLIATPVVLYSAAPFFRGAWRDLRSWRAGMDVPVAFAIAGAYLASLWHTFAGAGEVYFDSVSMFVFFLLIGRYVEHGARHQVIAANGAIAATLPATAERLDADGISYSVPLAQLAAGDCVRVRNGDTVPADGVLLDDAAALLDEALLCGESKAIRRRMNDAINAGAINRGAPFTFRITRTGADTLLSAITRLLERAQASRPRLARLADRIARGFVAGVLLAASVTALAWWQLDAARAFEITLSVLVVTCPCALALAVPVALTAATGALATRGVLTVNTDALETLTRVTDVVFDKTGTLTQGAPRIRRVTLHGALTEPECLALAAGLEAQSNHPIARAFTGSAVPMMFTDVEQHAGLGLVGEHRGRRYRIGAPAFAWQRAGAMFDGNCVLLADDDGPLAAFELEDALRDDARETVHALRDMGLELHLLSGDGEAAVQPVADALGIRDAHARQLPDDKLARIRALQAKGRRVLMIGDGINDAPVLAGADVSVAMSEGAPLAHASADFVLAGRLRALPELLRRARAAERVMRQNLYWALGYNAIALPLAACGLIAPWMAAIGMSASSLLVTLNALRLRTPPREQVIADASPKQRTLAFSR